jgi:hypothetical protein
VGQTWESRIGRVAAGVEDGVECLWSVMGKTGLLDGAKRADSGAIVARNTMATTRKIGHRYLLTNILASGILSVVSIARCCRGGQKVKSVLNRVAHDGSLI